MGGGEHILDLVRFACGKMCVAFPSIRLALHTHTAKKNALKAMVSVTKEF